MKKLMSLLLSALLLMTGLALAETRPLNEETWTETVTYRGDGVFVLDFIKDIPWRTEYILTLKDDSGASLTCTALGGDAGEAVVQVQGEIRENALYTFSLVGHDSVIHAVGQSTPGFAYANYCEYCLEFGHDDRACAARQAAGVYEVDRCDLCGSLDHEDDFCPTRQSGVYCDECAEYGHDDDVCIYDTDDDPYDRCDRCGQYGHDDEFCTQTLQPTSSPASGTGNQLSAAPQTRQEYCDDCREYGHDDDECPYERCDYCGQMGHDDDRCPSRTCKRCGEKGHSGDSCPQKRCDECGKMGHDDDHCPNERCDECGKTGHDDDDCPYDRDDD